MMAPMAHPDIAIIGPRSGDLSVAGVTSNLTSYR